MSCATAIPRKRHFFNASENPIRDIPERLIILAVIDYALADYRRGFLMPTPTNLALALAAYTWLNKPYNPSKECSLSFWCNVVFVDPKGMYERIRKMAADKPPEFCPKRLEEACTQNENLVFAKKKTYTREGTRKVGRPRKEVRNDTQEEQPDYVTGRLGKSYAVAGRSSSPRRVVYK